MKNCSGLAGETVPGSTTTVWRALSTLSTVLCLCGMKLKRSISTRSSKTFTIKSTSKQFWTEVFLCVSFILDLANPGYLACISVDQVKGLTCVKCVGHTSSSHTRDLYILRFLHLLRVLISSASKLSGLSNRHRETCHFLEGSSVPQLPPKMPMLQHCLCLVRVGLDSTSRFASCQNMLKLCMLFMLLTPDTCQTQLLCHACVALPAWIAAQSVELVLLAGRVAPRWHKPPGRGFVTLRKNRYRPEGKEVPLK